MSAVAEAVGFINSTVPYMLSGTWMLISCFKVSIRKSCEKAWCPFMGSSVSSPG